MAPHIGLFQDRDRTLGPFCLSVDKMKGCVCGAEGGVYTRNL